MNNLLGIYHRIPYLLKGVLVSAKGYQLQHLRYSAQTEQKIEEANLREKWNKLQWEEWYEKQISKLLDRAVKEVPFYRDYWQRQKRVGNNASSAYLENWPIIKKEDLLKNPLAFIADDCVPKHMYVDHTSGTSGTPLLIYQSQNTIQAWYALFEARWRRWYGVSFYDRWAIFGGRLIIPYRQKKRPFWVWNAPMKQLYCSSYHISDFSSCDYLNALAQYKVKYILGYPSALYALAEAGLRLGLEPPNLKFILSNAEPLYEYQREMIINFFKVPVYNTYGMSEMVCAASECKHGMMHLWPETGNFEVLTEDNYPSVRCQTGRLISTGLINFDMPLIRYEVGDRIAIDSSIYSCACGRTLPYITEIEGRSDDLIYTKDGRKIGRLDPIFKQKFHIKGAQIIQESLDIFTIRYIPTDNWTKRDADEMRDALIQRVGEVNVMFEQIDSLPLTKAGKFQAVISKVVP